MNERIRELAKFISSKIKVKPEIAIIVGKDEYKFLSKIKNPVYVKYNEIPGFPCLLENSLGKFVSGTINGRPIIVMHGRLHSYYNYSNGENYFPIYALKEMGCSTLIIGGTCGAIAPKFKVGDIAVVSDHINLTGAHPLISNIQFDRRRFFDMSAGYSKDLIAATKRAGKCIDIKVKTGVIAQFPGSTLETFAEIKFVKAMQAEILALNIIDYVIAANFCGMGVVCPLLVSNYCTAYSKNKIKYEDVKYNLRCADDYYSDFILNLIAQI